MKLIDIYTEEDRVNYYSKLIQIDLVLPFDPRVHQRMLLNLENLSGDIRREFQQKIWEKFYSREEDDSTNKGFSLTINYGGG